MTRLGNVGGDFLIHIESFQKNLESADITAPGAGGPFNCAPVTAYPLIKSGSTYTLALATQEASVNAFLVAGRDINDLANSGVTAEVQKHTVIDAYDGAVLNESVIPANDPSAAATAFDVAAIVTAVTALGAKFKKEPAETTIQTN